MQDLAWPEDWNVVPPWRLKQERRAVELGIRIPAYRTKQEFHDAAQRCLERLEPNVELKLEPQVEQGVSPIVPFKVPPNRGTRSERHQRSIDWIYAWLETNGEWPRWTDVHHTLRLKKATASRYLSEAKRIHRATIPERLAA